MDIPRHLTAFTSGETEELVDAMSPKVLVDSLERRQARPSYELLVSIARILPTDLLEAELADREQVLDQSSTAEDVPATPDEWRAKLRLTQAVVNRIARQRERDLMIRNRAVLGASEKNQLTRRDIASALGVTSARVQQIIDAMGSVDTT